MEELFYATPLISLCTHDYSVDKVVSVCYAGWAAQSAAAGTFQTDKPPASDLAMLQYTRDLFEDLETADAEWKTQKYASCLKRPFIGDDSVMETFALAKQIVERAMRDITKTPNPEPPKLDSCSGHMCGNPKEPWKNIVDNMKSLKEAPTKTSVLPGTDMYKWIAHVAQNHWQVPPTRLPPGKSIRQCVITSAFFGQGTLSVCITGVDKPVPMAPSNLRRTIAAT